jgi:hypothetical protein
MCDRPHLGKREMIAWARRCGLTPSRAYAQGFAHDNCGGFCIKAGLGHYATLLRERPDVYRQHEAEEANPIFGGHTVLRERSGGETTPLSLKQYREQLQAGRQPDLFDIGGCGCYVE